MDYKNWKIFFVNKFNIESNSPMATVSTMTTHSLAQLGAESHLIIEGNGLTNPDELLREKFKLEPMDNFHLRIFSRYITGKIKFTQKFYIKAIDYILANRQRGGRNIVISRNTTFLPFMAMLERLYNFITIFEAHGYHGNAQLDYLPDREQAVKEFSHYRILEKRYLNHLDGMIAITKPQMQLYQKDFLRVPAITLPLGANIDDEDELDDDNYEKNHLVYAGRLTVNIDYELVFDALKELPSMRFTWLGLKDADISTLQPIIEDKGISDRVTLKGWIHHSDMIDFLKHEATIGLANYKGTFEACAYISPTKIFDYYASGLPVITINVPNFANVVRDEIDGVLYEPGNVKSFISAINKILKNRKNYMKMRSYSHEHAKYFSWKNRSRRILDFAEELIGGTQ